MKVTVFFPNACYICDAVNKLKRCSRCQMVSYCGGDHQREHWPEHKSFCRAILTIMRENRVSHIFEKLRGLDMESWAEERIAFHDVIYQKLNRPINADELEIIQHPRSCFVCYDTRQENLKNCPGCPSASFCKEHPSSSQHDRECSRIKNGFEMGIQMMGTLVLTEPMKAIMRGTLKINESTKLPDSMAEFIEQYCKPGYDISECEKVCMSVLCSAQLTFVYALQKLNYPSVSKLIIHAEGYRSGKNWELLLHLLPSLKILKVVYESVFRDEEKITLCKECLARGKKLILKRNEFPYEFFMNQEDYEVPDIMVIFYHHSIFDDYARINWQIKLTRSGELNCPIVLAIHSEIWAELLKKNVSSTLQRFITCYYGPNEFASLCYLRDYLTGRVCTDNYFMMVIKPETGQDVQSKVLQLTLEGGNVSPFIFYYASYCPICCSTKISVTCKRCKMIYYCGKDHQYRHLSQHKDICKVISKMLNESGASNLFDNFKNTDSESWMMAKINLLNKAKTKLGREMLEQEKEMFLFPKTCFVCHESGPNTLKNCKCGIFLCKVHKDNLKHRQFCAELSLVFNMSIPKEPSKLSTGMKANVDWTRLYSMKAYIDSHFVLLEADEKNDAHVQKILFSTCTTRPLTFVYAIKKLGLINESPIVIHVIGATGMEIGTYYYWKALLLHMDRVKKFKVVFIGPKVLSPSPYLIPSELPDENTLSELNDRRLKIECHALEYNAYFQSKAYVKPTIIMGFNLNIHEGELGISKFNWKETILTLQKVDAPFILTAGTEERAQKEHKELCKLVEKTVDFTFLGINPFAAMLPERDFATEGVLYSNKYIIIYDGKYKNSTNSKKKKQKLVQKSSDAGKSELARKLSECRITKPKIEP